MEIYYILLFRMAIRLAIRMTIHLEALNPFGRHLFDQGPASNNIFHS